MRALSAVWLTTLVVTIASAIGLSVLARRAPGRPDHAVNVLLALVLIVTSVVWIVETSTTTTFSVATSLPFPLCDLATLVAAAALITRHRLTVELTYFWGLAGTIQSLVTPDLSVPYPHLQFFEYVIAHAGIVCAAAILVIGEKRRPRPYSVPRVFLVTLAYTTLVGFVDWWTGGNYMYLRATPRSWTLLSALGPWPWYIASAAGVAIVLFSLLDLPFMVLRRASRRRRQPLRSPPQSLRPARNLPA